ncbi:MAG: hypothetical protein INH41_04065 [Myxococcaceae bacterium]|jgi:type I restriction enzyme S subunit|nr:hypothetical protein [Myxococcaceae bacterium]
MADFVETVLADAATFLNGDRGENYPSGDAFVSMGVPFVNAGHLLPSGRVDWASMDYISAERLSLLRGGRFQVNDILFCIRGSLGKMAFVSEPTATGTIASSLVIIRARRELCEPRYLYYHARSV